MSHLLNSKIGIIVPSFFEAQFVNNKLNEKNVSFYVSGMGKLRVLQTANKMVKDGCKAILLTGYAGGIANLGKGDVVIAIGVTEGDYDTRPLEEYPNSLPCNSIPISKAYLTYFISQDKFITKNIYKGFIHDSHCVATDMESYAVAFAGKELGVSSYIVKIISDVVGNNTEKDFLSACSEMSDKLNKVIKESISLIRKRMK